MINSNVNNVGFRGIVRWNVEKEPIKVYTGGVPRFDEAVSNIENYTNGLIRFERVDNPDSIKYGIVMSEGTAGDGQCGNILSSYADSSGVIIGKYTANMGSDTCDDSAIGVYPSTVAEHELIHGLGLKEHFKGFGSVSVNAGIKNDTARAVVMNLYQNKIGATLDELQICSY